MLHILKSHEVIRGFFVLGCRELFYLSVLRKSHNQKNNIVSSQLYNMELKYTLKDSKKGEAIFMSIAIISFLLLNYFGHGFN